MSGFGRTGTSVVGALASITVLASTTIGCVALLGDFDVAANGAATDGAADAGNADAPASDGQGTDVARETATASDAGDAPSLESLELSPLSYDFRQVAVGQPSPSQAFTVTNRGTTSKSVSASLTQSTHFTIASNQCGAALPPNGSCAVGVVFKPNATGLQTSALVLSSPQTGQISASLRGVGMSPAELTMTPGSRDYLQVNVGLSIVPGQMFTVQNTGSTPSSVPSVTLSDPTNYRISNNTCSQALAPSGTCAIDVQFRPTTVGAKPATLSVSAQVGGDAGATLSGSGSTLATVSVSGSGAVSSTPSGVTCPGTCSAEIDSAPVTFTPSAGADHYFSGWGGDCTGIGGCSISNPGATTSVSATFLPRPNSTITRGPPPVTNGANLAFEFTSDTGGSTFVCQIDGEPTVACTSPHVFSNVPVGTHVLRVWAAANGVDETSPATMNVERVAANVPILYYRFEGNANNAGPGGGYHGVATNVSYPAGKYNNNAVLFDGTNATGAVMPQTSEFFRSTSTKWTWSLWFKEDVGKTSAYLLNTQGPPPPVGPAFGFFTWHGGVSTSLTTCAAAGCATFPSPALGAWHNLVYRYDGTATGGTMTFYLDGVLQAPTISQGSLAVFGPNMTDLNVGNSSPGGTRPSVFYVDEMKLFDQVYAPDVQCTTVIGGTWNNGPSTCTMP
jgi:hypothetical protein